MARAVNASLSIVAVGDELSKEEMSELARAGENIGDLLDARLDAVLSHAKTKAQALNLKNVQLVRGWGDAAETIIDLAREGQIDLLIAGRRGRGRLSGLLLGSVSQKLTTLAPCPVMIVP